MDAQLFKCSFVHDKQDNVLGLAKDDHRMRKVNYLGDEGACAGVKKVQNDVRRSFRLEKTETEMH